MNINAQLDKFPAISTVMLWRTGSGNKDVIKSEIKRDITVNEITHKLNSKKNLPHETNTKEM
jgi:hypothetical protein